MGGRAVRVGRGFAAVVRHTIALLNSSLEVVVNVLLFFAHLLKQLHALSAQVE